VVAHREIKGESGAKPLQRPGSEVPLPVDTAKMVGDPTDEVLLDER